MEDEEIGSVEQWIAAGIALATENQFEEAIYCFDQVIALESTNIKAWYNKGLCLKNLSRYAEAFTCFSLASLAAPEDADVQRKKSEVLKILRKHATQPRQHHYQFAHRVLPEVVRDHSALLYTDFRDALGYTRLQDCWYWVAEQLPMEDRLVPDGLNCTFRRYEDFGIVLISMPPPINSAEAYFIGIAFGPISPLPEQVDSIAFRYFTLEYGMPSAAGRRTVLGEWSKDDDGALLHINYGPGTELNLEAFFTRICSLLPKSSPSTPEQIWLMGLLRNANTEYGYSISLNANLEETPEDLAFTTAYATAIANAFIEGKAADVAAMERAATALAEEIVGYKRPNQPVRARNQLRQNKSFPVPRASATGRVAYVLYLDPGRQIIW